jgi:hypothetical protein
LQRANEISGLKRQIKFDFEINGVQFPAYVVDFIYTTKTGHKIHEDFKGAITADGKIKLLMMKALYGIDVQLIDKKGNFTTIFSKRPKKRRKKA